MLKAFIGEEVKSTDLDQKDHLGSVFAQFQHSGSLLLYTSVSIIIKSVTYIKKPFICTR